MIDKNFLEYNDGRIYYEECGTGESIIFIHGFTLDHRMWQTQVDYFSKTNRVITYDVRGFGKSSLPTDTYSHYDDLYNLMEHLAVSAAHIVGLSMGGGIATGFTILNPEKVLSLTLIDSDIHGYKSTVDWNVHAGEVGVEGARRNWLNHEVFTTAQENEDVTKELTTIVNDYSGWHWLNRDPGKRIDALKRLGETHVKTTVLVGERDLPYFRTIADMLEHEIPNARKVIVPGVGHMVNMEASDVCNELIQEIVNN